MRFDPETVSPPLPPFHVFQERVDLRTEKPQQFIDITVLVAERVRRSGIARGLVNVQTRHTTTAVLVNENEPLLLEDLARLLRRWAPRDLRYRHDEIELRQAPCPPDEPANGHAHARAVLLGASESLDVVGGRLHLGRWQSLFLVELDGPRERSISITVLGAPS